MLQLYKNIQTDFLGQIFRELFQFKTQPLFWAPSICQVKEVFDFVRI